MPKGNNVVGQLSPLVTFKQEQSFLAGGIRQGSVVSCGIHNWKFINLMYSFTY